jgi:hypothetical protein
MAIASKDGAAKVMDARMALLNFTLSPDQHHWLWPLPVMLGSRRKEREH